MVAPPTYLWTGDGLVESEPITPDEVLAADSWRLEDGKVVALERHRVRFQDTVCVHRSLIETSHEFVEAVVNALPREGSWFPRIDLIRHNDSVWFRYQQRPRPPVDSRAVVTTARLDPRVQPTIKGPDLHALAALRLEAQEEGADEAIIVRNGYICEGAYSTVMAWSMDKRTLHSMGTQEPRVPSVTESVVRDIAAENGVRVSADQFSPHDLDGLEVWIVSALHGIRHARAWVDGPTLVGDSGLRSEFQARWLEKARPIGQPYR